jgi:hypothetical protein
MIDLGNIQKGDVALGLILLGPVLISGFGEMVALLTADGIAVKTGDNLTVYINP